jgi:ABC-type enterochelin transport system substrate-binding protein
MKFNKIAISFVGVVALLSACGTNENDAANKASSQKILAAESTVAPAGTFSGARNNYTITKTASGVTVTDNSNGAVTTLDNSVQSLKFSDLTVNLLIGDKAASIAAADLKSLTELYLAYFNRVPDADGLLD